MTDDYILISTLNDFVFCPYSIYLHNVYMDTDTDMYHAFPQVKGRAVHASVDAKQTSGKSSIIESLNVVSHKYGLMGKIDVLDCSTGRLTERKNNLKHIFQGQIYQLWAQYLCLEEMGYTVKSLFFYEVSTKRHIGIQFPDTCGLTLFENLLQEYREFDPREFGFQNQNKCLHCIYCGLCDKSTFENVY